MHEFVDRFLLTVDSQVLSQFRIEHDFRTLAQFFAELDHFFVWKFYVHFGFFATVEFCNFSFGVFSNITLFFFDFFDELPFIRLIEWDLRCLSDERAQCLGHGPSGHEVLAHSDLIDLPVNDWDSVTHSITHVQNSAGGFTGREERQHGLDVHLEPWHFK